MDCCRFFLQTKCRYSDNNRWISLEYIRNLYLPKNGRLKTKSCFLGGFLYSVNSAVCLVSSVTSQETGLGLNPPAEELNLSMWTLLVQRGGTFRKSLTPFGRSLDILCPPAASAEPETFFKNHHILLALSCTTSCPLVGATDPSNQRKADSEATTALSSTPAIISLLCNISQLSEQCLTFLVTELVPSFYIYCANDYLFFVFFLFASVSAAM